MSKPKWYSLNQILKYNAIYNMIIGKRSNGKTYAVQEKILKDFCDGKGQGAIIRRWEEDYRGRRGQATFQALVDNGLVSKYTNGEWTNIKYKSGKWYLCKRDDGLDKDIVSEEPFCFAFALTMAEHDKSTSYPRVINILFDEFITRNGYLPDEFILFTNILSTIIRQRDNVTIFMLGNTVNKYCPYFAEMGIAGIDSMKQGTIEVYHYKNNAELKVAVEYCGEGKSKGSSLGSDKYFGFDNPKLKMITTGVWELANYPHLPVKYEDKDVVYHYYIVFNNQKLRCNIIAKDGNLFTFIHWWTRDIEPNVLVFSSEYAANPLIRRRIIKPVDKIGKFIARFYATERVFYADNNVGELVRNYIQWCNTDKGVQ